MTSHRSQRLSLFSPVNFVVLFTFNSMIHFELILTWGVRLTIEVHLCLFCFYYTCPHIPARFIEKSLSFIELFMHLCKKSLDYIFVVIVCVFCYILLMYVSLPLPIAHYLDYYSYVVNLNFREWFFLLYSSFKNCFSHSRASLLV